MIQYIVNLILFFLPSSRLFSLKRLLLTFSGAVVGKNVRVARIRVNAVNLIIGDNTFIGDETMITGGKSTVTIGQNCDISSRVSIVTGTHKIGSILQAAGEGYSENIIIGNGVWIGCGATILHGITIGDGSIIAAGSVVTKNIPPGVLAAGVPAVVKRNLF
jgi:maltose O-acetyltransferase